MESNLHLDISLMYGRDGINGKEDAMINPVITKKSGAYQTEEGCLSLKGVRPCTRYQEIEVDYLDQNLREQ